MLEKDTAKVFVRIEPILWEEDDHNILAVQDTKIAAGPSSPHLILGKSTEIQTEAVVVELEAIESEIVSVESAESESEQSHMNGYKPQNLTKLKG